MNDSRLRFGLIGAGGISASWSQAIQDLAGECRLVAVADVDPQRAESLAAAHPGAQVFASARQMQMEAELDAAIICTPPLYHPEQTCDLVSRGVHVLCEKPLALTVEDAERMAAAATSSGAVFTMASKFRFVPDVLAARQIILDGRIGEPLLFENQFTGVVDMSRRWNSNPAVSGGGVLIDNGTHSLDILRFFVGPVVEVMVVEGRRIQPLPVEDTVHVFARSQSGVLGSIDLSWSLAKGSPWFISLHGTRGGIQIGWKESVYRESGGQDWIRFGSGYDKRVAFRGQLANFLGAIRGREPLVITSAEGIASVAAVQAAYAALRGVTWTPVSQPA